MTWHGIGGMLALTSALIGSNVVAQQEETPSGTVASPSLPSLPAQGPTAPPDSETGIIKSCPVTLDGSAFLAEASQRGIALKSPQPCTVVKLATNQFFAPPNAACSILFESGSWLKPNAQFTSLHGAGSFSVSPLPTGILVTIAAKGGFRLDNISVEAKHKDCSQVRMESVLR